MPNAMKMFPYALNAGIGLAVGITSFFASSALEKKMVERRNIAFKKPRCESLLLVLLSIILGFFFVISEELSEKIFLSIAIFALYTLSVTDVKYRIIPNSMVLLLLATRFADFETLKASVSLLESLLGLTVCMLIFFIPSLTGAHIGFGDIKLAGAAGFAFGLRTCLLAMCVMGLILLLDTLVISKIGTSGAMTVSAALKRKVPLGPAFSVSLLAVQALTCFVPMDEIICL